MRGTIQEKDQLKSNRAAIGLLLFMVIVVVTMILAWAEVWKRGGTIRKLEDRISEMQSELRSARVELEDLQQTPIAYLLLYRRATLARFERIEPRWDEIMEQSWRASLKHGVPAEITIAKIEHESNFNPEAVGSKGELGLMQIYPPAWPQFDTARGMEIAYNVDFGCSVFASCMKQAKGNIREALRLYNGKGELAEGMIPYPDRVLNGRSMKVGK